MQDDFLIRIAFYVSAAMAVFLLVEFAYLVLIAPLMRRRSINRRLGALMEGGDGEQALILLKRERGVLDGDVRLMRGLRKLLVQSGLRITVTKFLVAVLLASLLIAGILKPAAGLPLWACAVAGFALGAGLPVLALRSIRARRQQQFLAQLPDALDMLIRSLKSGHPVQTAMLFVGREMPDPIGTEFGMTVDEMTYGLGIEAALQNLMGRVGVPELSFLVTTTSLQGSTGGNLAEVLVGLSRIIRDRFQLRRKVRAISSEGRMSAYALTGMPVLIATVLHLQNPDYYGDVWNEPLFRLAIFGLIAWQVVGYVIMLKMINFKF